MPKEKNKILATIKKLKSTSKGLAIWRLIKWCIFFFLLFVFCLIASFITPKNTPNPSKPNNDINNSQIPEVKQFSDYNSYFNETSYDYEYVIKNDLNSYAFDGEVRPNSHSGYKDKNGNIIKYYFDGDSIYQIINNEKVSILDFYEDFDRELFTLSKIYAKIKDLNFALDNNVLDAEAFNAKDSINSYTVTFYENRFKINIKTSSYEYNMDINIRR